MGETVVLYSLAAILSACVAALGFKISDKSKGGISITKMAEDLAKSAVPGFKVILGTAAMALEPGAFYAYMQIVNGKTSVPQNLISWVQNWLSENSAYDESVVTVTPKLIPDNLSTGVLFEGPVMTLGQLLNDSDLLSKSVTLSNIKNSKIDKVQRFVNLYNNLPCIYENSSGHVFCFPLGSNLNSRIESVHDLYYKSRYVSPPRSCFHLAFDGIYSFTEEPSSWSNPFCHVSKKDYYLNYDKAYSILIYAESTTVSNSSGFEAGENVPGKDVVIPGEGTGELSNEDIVGWLQSAVGAAVASALGIGTATIPFVPVAVKNPAITGDITDALDNVIDQAQDIAQAGATDVDTVTTGEKYANTSLAPSKPSGNISASSLYTIWNPSQAQLNNLARFLWSTDFVDTIKKILQSPMDALISLALFPVKPPTDGAHNISLGYIDSGVSALRVSDQFMTVQTSGLVVPHKYNSYLDYAPYTSAEIFLPFIGFCPLNINDIMGKSVDVTYNIDLLSGVCTAIVHANAQSLYSYSGNMAMFLPLSAGNWARMLTPIFGMVGGVASLSAGIGGVMGGAPLLASTSMAVHGAESIGNLGGNSVSRSGGISGNAGIMGDYQPFIVVTRPINDKPTTYDTNIGQTYNKSAQLGTLSGFTVIEEAHIEGMNATESEKQEIERLLKEGVIL